MASEIQTWNVEKFGKLLNEKWTRILKDEIVLKVFFDQAFLISNNIIFETFKLKNIKKAYLKHKTLLLIYLEQETLQKAKMKFSCSDEEIGKLMKILESHFPLTYVEELSEVSSSEAYKTFRDMFKEEMDRQSNLVNIATIFPQDFPLEEFMKTCILDPDFSQFVDQVEKNFKQCFG